MIDPVELIAQRLWYWATDAQGKGQSGVESFHEEARALLAELRPLIEAEEREECAKVADDAEEARILEHLLAPRNSTVNQFALHRMREARAIAAAIRERGKA